MAEAGGHLHHLITTADGLRKLMNGNGMAVHSSGGAVGSLEYELAFDYEGVAYRLFLKRSNYQPEDHQKKLEKLGLV